MFKDLKTGLVYRNPKPHVRSVHAYFPSVVAMDNGELLATMVLGEAFEAVNCCTHLARSRDNGDTWQIEGRLYPGAENDRLTSDSSRITALPGGEIVVFMIKADRTDYPEEGLANPVNMGFVPTELFVLRSRDYGRTWEGSTSFKPPFEGSSFEMCCPITPLKDGRWLLPTSIWRGWDGSCPNGKKMVAFVSRDRGASWPEYLDVMVDPKQEIVYWESKIIELEDGRLLSVAWAYNEKEAKDLPNQYVLSKDNGKTWTKPDSTGLIGQTMTPFLLDDNRILSVYRRIDKSGLWANLSHLDGDKWVNDSCGPLWGNQASNLIATTENMVRNFNVLKFGAPCITRLSDGTIFIAFWCYEDCVSVIRWFKFNL